MPGGAAEPAEETGLYVQAALALPEGIGVIRWDAEEAVRPLSDPAFFGREAGRRPVPFEACEPALRALLAPHAPGLLSELLRRLAPLGRDG